MSSPLPPLPLGDPTAFVRRVYGASPLRGQGELLALRFNADGLLWSLEEPGILRQWDLASQEEVKAVALDELATLWQFDPRGRHLAGASDEVGLSALASTEAPTRLPFIGTPSILVPSSPHRHRFEAETWVTALAFHPSGALLATGYDDGTVRVWDLSKLETIRTFSNLGGGVSSLAFDPTGATLAVASEDRVVRLWDLTTSGMVLSLLGHTDRIPALAWHPDGRRLLSAGWDTTARVWDTTTGEPIILLNAHQGQVFTFALSPDGGLLACADSSNAVHLWSLDDYQERGVLRDRCAAEIRALTFSPNGRRLVFGGIDRTLNQWDVTRPQQEANQLGSPQLNRTGIAVPPSGQHLASLGMGTPLRVFEISSGEPLPQWSDTRPLRAMASSPCSRYLAGSLAAEEAPNDSKRPTPLVLWDALTGQELGIAEEQGQPITLLTFSPTGDRLASASYQSSNVWLWTTPGLEPLLLINNAVEGLAVQSVAFHPEGRLLAIAGIDHLATSGRDGHVEIYDPEAKQTVRILPGGASVAAFSPDGRLLIAATVKLALRVIDWQTGSVVHEVHGPTEPINAVVFSPDGTLLAVGSDDHTIRLLDAATFRVRAALELDEQIKALAFSPDGRFLFTGNGDGTAYQLAVEQILVDAATI